MMIRPATAKEVRFSCLRYHYAHSVPCVTDAYSVFDDDDGDFCGCVCFGPGANNHIGSPYGLAFGQIIELERVALNGRQGHGHTSQAVMGAVRALRRDNPLLRLIVSYADRDQGHIGKIYQATNWLFVGMTKQSSWIGKIVVDGKAMHLRSCSAKYGTTNIDALAKMGHDAHLQPPPQREAEVPHATRPVDEASAHEDCIAIPQDIDR